MKSELGVKENRTQMAALLKAVDDNYNSRSYDLYVSEYPLISAVRKAMEAISREAGPNES